MKLKPNLLNQVLSPELQTELITLTSQNSVTEQCGIITTDNQILEFSNTHPNPEDNFYFDLPESLQPEPKIIWHTHIRDDQAGELSEEDIIESKNKNIPYLVYHTGFREWDYFDPTLTANPFPLSLEGDPSTLGYYTGLPFVWNRMDCYSLVRAWYSGHFQIELRDYPRPPNSDQLLADDWDTFNKILPENGFYEVFRLPREHDVLLFRAAGKAENHLGVMINDKSFLHHLGENHLSQVELLEGNWQRRLTKVFAHIDLLEN